MKTISELFKALVKQRGSEGLDKRFPLAHIHRESSITDFVSIDVGTRINGPAYINAHEKVKVMIGKYCAIGHNLRIRAVNHSMGYPNLQNALQTQYGFEAHRVFKGSIEIGNNVWIGDNVIVLSGAKIGDGACIGAGSIVTKDIPAYSVVAGSPAKIIRYRFDSRIINQLTKIQWWNWSPQKIERNQRFFETDLNLSNDLNIHALVVD